MCVSPRSDELCALPLYHNHLRSTATTGGRETLGCVLATRFANVSVVVCFISGFLCVITSQPSTSVSFFCDQLNQERRKKKNHHVAGEWETEDYRESKCTVLHTHLSEGGGASTARGLATIVHAYNIFFFNPFVNVCKTPHVTGDISFLTHHSQKVTWMRNKEFLIRCSRTWSGKMGDCIVYRIIHVQQQQQQQPWQQQRKLVTKMGVTGVRWSLVR